MTRTMQTHRRSTGPDVIASREADHGDGVQAQQEKGDRPYAYYHAHPNLQSWNPPSAAPPQRPPELVHMRLQSKYMREANEISREHNILLREQNDILRKKNDIMLELNRSLQHGVQRMLQRVTTKGGMDVETSGSQGRKRPPPERTDRTDQEKRRILSYDPNDKQPLNQKISQQQGQEEKENRMKGKVAEVEKAPVLTKPKPIQKTSIVLKSSTVPDLPKDRQAKMRSDKAPVDKAPVKTTSNVDKEGGEEKKPKVRFNAMPVETTCRDGLCNVKNNAGILCPNQVDQGAATAITRARCFPHNVQINKLSGPRYVKRNAEVNWAKMFNMNATIEPFHPDEEGEEGEEEEEGPRVIDMNSLARSRLLNSVKKIFSPTSQQAATTLTMLKTNNP